MNETYNLFAYGWRNENDRRSNQYDRYDRKSKTLCYLAEKGYRATPSYSSYPSQRIGGDPSRAPVRRVRAGGIPTIPAARCMVPVATAVVWTTINLRREGFRYRDKETNKIRLDGHPRVLPLANEWVCLTS